MAGVYFADTGNSAKQRYSLRCNAWFCGTAGDRRFLESWRPRRPGNRFQEVGCEAPHLLEGGFPAAGAAQTPKHRRFPVGPSTMYSNPPCVFLPAIIPLFPQQSVDFRVFSADFRWFSADFRPNLAPKPLWNDGARLAVPVAPQISPADQF